MIDATEPGAPAVDPSLLLSLARGGRHSDARAELVARFGSDILAVVHGQLGPRSEEVVDCFVFVCDKLGEHDCRRLRTFDPARATFLTWLRVVTRNLCVDWRRTKSGRSRAFRALDHLPLLHWRIFDLRYLEGRSELETLAFLRQDYPTLDRTAVAGAIEEIEAALSPRHRWLLRVRAWRAGRLATPRDGASGEPLDAQALGPQEVLLSREVHARLAKVLASLESVDRLLLQLRYEQELELKQIAPLLGLRNAQQVDRRIRALLVQLRERLEAEGQPAAARLAAPGPTREERSGPR